MSRYIYDQPDWPQFGGIKKRWRCSWRRASSAGRLIGRMETLGFSLREEATLKTLTLDVLKSSEIEGEILSPEQVRSSIARRLGMDVADSCRQTAMWKA